MAPQHIVQRTRASLYLDYLHEPYRAADATGTEIAARISGSVLEQISRLLLRVVVLIRIAGLINYL